MCRFRERENIGNANSLKPYTLNWCQEKTSHWWKLFARDSTTTERRRSRERERERERD